ncbi:hypothetical protein SBF1_1590007 [Candidatus Desulfosporosinus infrequens]|uniref:Uncharacterized protein n=1 Tax=Candidatus Desulfosporosinus infrequens TaxID=2043169 RepID=A0A2U3K9A7_9FIRM|nr:hypothetical protein SBF1_1590007 [Candidatus Desulfosporosinus infrequens]
MKAIFQVALYAFVVDVLVIYLGMDAEMMVSNDTSAKIVANRSLQTPTLLHQGLEKSLKLGKSISNA